nr:biotin-dependent carboxyltransferase family protein [uncultured Psychroserpens sp.]
MVEVLKAGLFDTIQDFGRIGFQEFGVPFSGVMDENSASLANSIIGNDQNAAVIECTVIGLQLKFHAHTLICITGAQMNPNLNGLPIKNNTAISVRPNDILGFGRLEYGCRSYISVSNGFLTEEIMASRSMYQGITSRFKLQKGDLLPISKEEKDKTATFSSIKINKNHFQSQDIEVFKGPEFDKLNLKQQKLLCEQQFTISKDSNRMAYLFDECFDNALHPIITSLVLPGTVQLTPSGQLIVLMRDCQTTGGYPRVFQLTEKAMNMMSQKFFGGKVRFKCIK